MSQAIEYTAKITQVRKMLVLLQKGVEPIVSSQTSRPAFRRLKNERDH